MGLREVSGRKRACAANVLAGISWFSRFSEGGACVLRGTWTVAGKLTGLFEGDVPIVARFGGTRRGSLLQILRMVARARVSLDMSVRAVR